MKKLLSAVTSVVMSLTLMTGAFTSPVSAAGGMTAVQPNVSIGEVSGVAANKKADAEVSLDLGNYKVKPGQTFDVEVKIDCHNNAVSAGDVTYAIESPLEITELLDYSPALDDRDVMVNLATKKMNFTSLVDSEPSVIRSDDALMIVSVSVPANTPAGDYKISVTDAKIFKGNSSATWNTEDP